MKKKYDIKVIEGAKSKEQEHIKEVKKEDLIFYKPSILSSYSGLLILLMFIVICYMSVIKPAYFLWLLFGIVSIPILRRNFNYISVMVLSLGLIICATSGIVINGVLEMTIIDHLITKPMALGIAILGLVYITLISFYKNLKFIDSLNTLLFYFLVIISSYPIFIICLFLGSLLGFLGVTLLQILIYCLLALPIVIALYLILGKKKKKVIEVK